MATNPEPAGRRVYFGGPSLTEKRLTKRMVFVVALVAGMLGCGKVPPTPRCHEDCSVITAYALGRASGPLPHDCRFFRECGCAFQCEAQTQTSEAIQQLDDALDVAKRSHVIITESFQREDELRAALVSCTTTLRTADERCFGGAR